MIQHTRSRKDGNHNEIKGVFNSYGLSVHDVYQLPNFCDLIVGFGEYNLLVEIKDGSKSPSERRLTKGEQKHYEHIVCTGCG